MKKIVKSGPASTELADVAEPVATIVPAYWAEACKHLVKKDRVMKRLIPQFGDCLLYTSPSPRDKRQSRMPSSA